MLKQKWTNSKTEENRTKSLRFCFPLKRYYKKKKTFKNSVVSTMLINR